MEEVLLDIMYELPELNGYEVIITEEVVAQGTKPLYIKDKKIA
jgi:ATP-dependent Clp protease ATP-binding subunit ClpX